MDKVEGVEMSSKSEVDSKLVSEILEQVNRMSMDEVKADLELMEPEEVAEKLKCGRSTVYHYAEEGKLPASKIGTLIRIRPRALYAFILLKEKIGLGEAA